MGKLFGHLAQLFRRPVGCTGVQGYRGIKRTGPQILCFARQVIHDHMLDYADNGDIDEIDVQAHVEQAVAKLAGWPEAMTIAYLLRDMDIEDFYHV